MADIFDPRGNQRYKLKVPMLCAGTCTKDYGVSIDSSGDVTNSATATLSKVVGVACESGTAGQVIMVQIGGYFGSFPTDGNVDANDTVLCVVDGGTFVGHTEAEIAADPTLAYHIVAKALGADDANNKAPGWMVLGLAGGTAT